MAKVNFYLDKRDSENLRKIFLYFSFDGKRLKQSTGISVQEQDWNENQMRILCLPRFSYSLKV
jgi:hypothetical protein